LITALNPQHYLARVVELKVLAAESYTCLFELYHSKFSKTGKMGKRMNKSGKKAIYHWEYVREYMIKEKQNKSQSFINCLYNVGRIYSKLKVKTNEELKVKPCQQEINNLGKFAKDIREIQTGSEYHRINSKRKQDSGSRFGRAI
jgi:hypothetical protein